MARLKRTRLQDAYRFPGFFPLDAVQGVFGDPKAVVVKLSRRRKKRCAVDALDGVAVTTTTGSSKGGIGGFTWKWTFGGWPVRAVAVCSARGSDWLADNPFYTKRFVFYVGRRCRAGTIKDVARELCLDWHTVKEREQQSMREPLRRVGLPGSKVIGIDEISLRKGHS